MTTFPIYRSEARSYYPDDLTGYSWSFAPIAASVSTRKGTDLVTGSTDGADTPYATIRVPDGCELRESNSGDTCLFVPGFTAGFSAWEAYQLAKDHHNGFSVVEAKP